jgi:hypothetical protein
MPFPPCAIAVQAVRSLFKTVAPFKIVYNTVYDIMMMIESPNRGNDGRKSSQARDSPGA